MTKIVTNLLIFGILITLFSCGQTDKKAEPYKESRELIPNPEGYKKDSSVVVKIETNCNFNKFIKDPKTPKLAKELLNNTAKYSEEPTLYFANLKNNDIEESEFYFRVLTNSYKIADGGFAEGLGNFGKEFIEDNTKKFVSFFDNKECFTDKDLETWTDIAMLEFLIIGSEENDSKIIDEYNLKLQQSCINCSATQKVTIKKFTMLLKSKWQKHLKEME